MHLHDKNDNMKYYRNINQILEEFYEVRLEFYHLRKEYLLNKLQTELNIIKSKVRFIEMVIAKKLNIYNKKKDDIINLLKKNKFYVIKGEPMFDYLLKITFYSMTKEKIEELKKILKNKTVEFNKLKKTSIKQLWLNDLERLDNLLSNFFLT